MRKLLAICMTLLAMISLVACNNAQNKPTTNENKEVDKEYVLVENSVNGVDRPILEGEYIYLTFKTDGTCVNRRKMNGDTKETITIEKYTKIENYYLIVLDAFALKYMISEDGETLTLTYTLLGTIKQTYKLVK